MEETFQSHIIDITIFQTKSFDVLSEFATNAHFQLIFPKLMRDLRFHLCNWSIGSKLILLLINCFKHWFTSKENVLLCLKALFIVFWTILNLTDLNGHILVPTSPLKGIYTLLNAPVSLTITP